MITRVYLTKWERRLEIEGDEDSGFIWHPLLDAAKEIPAAPKGTPRDQRARMSVEVPAALADGAPSKPALLVFVTMNSIPDSYAELPGVYMFPPHQLDHKIDAISDKMKTDVVANLALFGVPYEDITGAADVGEFIDKIEDSLLARSPPTNSKFGHRKGDFA